MLGSPVQLRPCPPAAPSGYRDGRRAAGGGRFGRTLQQHAHNPFDVDPRERILVLGSVLGGLLAALILGFVFDPERTRELLVLVPGSFFMAGKFLPLASLSDQCSFSAYELGFVIWIMDTVTVLVVVYSLEALERIGPIGRALDRIHENARLVLDAYPVVRKLTILGVVLFVLFPVAGTGAIGGSFLGALLGLHRYVLIAAVSSGGFLGGMAMAYATVHFQSTVRMLEQNKANPLLIGALVLALVLAFVWLNRAYRSALERARRTNGGRPPVHAERPRRKQKTG